MRMRSRPVPSRRRLLGPWGIPVVLALLSGCTAKIGEPPDIELGAGGATGTGAGTSTGGGTTPTLCTDGVVRPGPAPLRRVTRFEYNNSVRDLLGDTTNPAIALPPEESGNGFGNDAAAQSVSSLLAEQYGTVAESIAARATATPTALAKLAPCASTVTATTEEACARTIIETFTPKAYRRALEPGEADALLTLEKSTRALPNATFATAVASVIEAVLQSPDFLYKLEWGVSDKARPDLKRPSGDEMAVRLAYLFWATTPDQSLRDAAKTGELETNEGVLTHATRLVDDPRARPVIRFFFDNLLPINGLTDLERDRTVFPMYSPAIGAALHEETQHFLEYEIFEGPGTWPAALTAPYTFVNAALATFYGIPDISGTAFQKVPLDPTKRLGLLTQAGIMAGTTHSNTTNPVVRGSFIVQKMLCRIIPLPSGEILAKVKPPDPYSAPTARERFTLHNSDPVCASCHSQMDPVGFTLENYDPVGLWRTQENKVTIDATGWVPGTEGTLNGPVELVRTLAEMPEAQNCFASHWLDFGYGRTLGSGDECAQGKVYDAFQKSGYNVRQMLIALTQTDEFLYLPGTP